MDAKEAIRKAIEAYMTLVDFNLLASGQERVLLCSGARSQLKAAQVAPEQIEQLSWQIADFVPIAFGRIKPRANVPPDDHYVRIDSQEHLRVYKRLDAEPFDCVALQYGQELAASGARELEILAKLSPEWIMLDWAITSGKKPEDLDASPPILNGPDELCDPLDQQPQFAERLWWMDSWKSTKPWWKFW